VRCLRAGQAAGAEESEAPLKRLLLLLCFCLPACSYLPVALRPLPSLEEQTAHIRKNELLGHVIVPEAFVQAWGPPTYEHGEPAQFLPADDGNWVPSFRIPLGQAPAGWDATIRTGDGYFMIYVERGELLGFLDRRLVSREKLAAAPLHAIGKGWKQEDIYKTGLEKSLTVPK